MNKKLYKVRLEENEHKALKIISCSNNISIQNLMETIILDFIDYQSKQDKPIKRKSEFEAPHLLNVPLSIPVSDELIKHRKEEGVPTTTVLNSAVTYWLSKKGVNPSELAQSIEIQGFQKNQAS